MRVCWRALGAAATATLALIMPDVARAQGSVQQPPRLPELPPATAPAEAPFEARVAAIMAELPPVRLGRTWQHVVDAALQRLDDLPQALAPAVDASVGEPLEEGLLRVPEPPVTANDVGPAENVPEKGPTFKVRKFRVTFAPVEVDSPAIQNIRGERAVLLGATMRFPELAP